MPCSFWQAGPQERRAAGSLGNPALARRSRVEHRVDRNHQGRGARRADRNHRDREERRADRNHRDRGARRADHILRDRGARRADRNHRGEERRADHTLRGEHRADRNHRGEERLRQAGNRHHHPADNRRRQAGRKVHRRRIHQVLVETLSPWIDFAITRRARPASAATWPPDGHEDVLSFAP
jgi:hypothetical protein